MNKQFGLQEKHPHEKKKKFQKTPSAEVLLKTACSLK